MVWLWCGVHRVFHHKRSIMRFLAMSQPPSPSPIWTQGFGRTLRKSLRAVDTNVVARLIARDDPRQTREAEGFISEGAWVSNLVLAECVWALESVYELTRTQVRTAISMLLEHLQLVLQEAVTVRGRWRTSLPKEELDSPTALWLPLRERMAMSPSEPLTRSCRNLAMLRRCNSIRGVPCRELRRGPNQ